MIIEFRYEVKKLQKLLVADDDNEIRELLEFDLSHSGYIVDIAKDGEEALNKALKGNYDLILLDVMMPKMNGFDVCKNIRYTNFNADGKRYYCR